MADRVITAEMVLNAKDNGVSDTLAKIAGKLDAVAKSAAHSEKVKELGRAFQSLDGQMQGLDRLNGAQKTLGLFQERAGAAAVKVKSLETAMAAVEKPNAAMVMSLTNAHAAFDKASAAVTRQAEAMRKAEGAVAAMGIPLGRASEVQERLRRDMDATTGAIERQMIADRRAAEAAKAGAVADRERIAAQHRLHDIAHKNGVGHLATNAAAAYVSAHGIMSVGEKAYEAGAEYQHEIVGLRNAGRTTKEIAEITEAAARVAKAVPTSTYIENLKVIAETTSAFGSVEHAMEHLQLMQKSMSVLKIAGGEHIKGGVGDVGRDFAKFFEERLTKPEDFDKEARQMIPAMVASGGTFNPHEMYMFGSQAKSSLANYDMDFLSTIVPSLVTASSGEKAGTAANAFNSIIMGKVNDKKQAEAWLKAGLLDPSKVIMKAGHAVGWSAGAVRGTELAMSNPLAWSEKYQIPALEKMGVNVHDRLDVAKALGTMYRNQNGNLFATEMTQEASRHRLHKDADLYRKAGSLESIYDRNLNNDPQAAMTGLTAAFTNLMTAVTAEGMKPAAEGITWVAGALGHLAEVAKDHPTAALATGGAALAGGLGVSGLLTARLLGGFGLPGAAAHLEASSIVLREAAGVMAAGHGLPGAPPGGTPPSEPGKPGDTSFGAGRWLAFGAGLIGLAMNAPSMDAAGDKEREGNAHALDGVGNPMDTLTDRIFGKGRKAGDAIADAWAAMHTVSAPLPPDRYASTAPNGDGNALRRWDEMPVAPHGVALPADTPAPEVVETFRLLPPAAHGAADALDRMKDREESLKDDFGLTGFVLGRLNEAAARAALSLASLGGAGGSGGGSGIIQAAYHPGEGGGFGGGSAAMTPLLRGQRGGGGVRRASLDGGGLNPYAGGDGGSVFVPPVGDHLTAGMRNNNLGNIGWFGQHTPGLLGPSNARDVDHSIGKFATQEDGIRAAASLALHKYMGGRHSAWDLIAAAGGWTPGALGPGASVNVARAMGLGNRDDLHLDQPGQMVKFLHGLAIQEHGPAGRFYDEGRIRDALGHKEHPALAAPALPKKGPGSHDGSAGVTTAHNELVGEVRKMTAAVERGGLHRFHVALDKGLTGKRTYQRGSVGSTIA